MIEKVLDWIDKFWAEVERWKGRSTSRGCLVELAQHLFLVCAALFFALGCGLFLILGVWLCGGF